MYGPGSSEAIIIESSVYCYHCRGYQCNLIGGDLIGGCNRKKRVYVGVWARLWPFPRGRGWESKMWETVWTGGTWGVAVEAEGEELGAPPGPPVCMAGMACGRGKMGEEQGISNFLQALEEERALEVEGEHDDGAGEGVFFGIGVEVQRCKPLQRLYACNVWDAE
eukprot:jgi/Botrbrau1/10135/Bobra.0191s0008.2